MKVKVIRPTKIDEAIKKIDGRIIYEIFNPKMRPAWQPDPMGPGMLEW